MMFTETRFSGAPMNFLSRVSLLSIISICGAAHAASPVSLPDWKAVIPEVVGSLGAGASKENSGIVKSRHYDDVYWVQNDSGDEPKVYPVHLDGSLWTAERYQDMPGVEIAGAINVDWEDITMDDKGHLIVCDVGNNRNDRRDLVLYYLNEPSPIAGRTTLKKKVFFRYPDQKNYPATHSDFNYDCEGVFFANGKIYFISKNRSDTFTKLYRLDHYDSEVTNELTYLDRFDIGGKTTAADATPDGRRLAVTTYRALWVFETDGVTDSYFDGKVYWLPFESSQVEAVCFQDPETILLADEQSAKIMRIRFADMKRVDTKDFTPID